MYDVPLFFYVTWRQIKHTIFACFLNLVNFVAIDLKIGTHIYWTYTMYHAKKYTDKNNVTCVSIATKYLYVKKHMAFFTTLTMVISPINKWRIPMNFAWRFQYFMPTLCDNK